MIGPAAGPPTPWCGRVGGVIAAMAILGWVRGAWAQDMIPGPSTEKHWVFFVDKGTSAGEMLAERPQSLGISQRALVRRTRRGAGALVDLDDVPVAPDYITEIRALGGVVPLTSRWLNAASVRAPRDVFERIAALKCVRAIGPVRRARRREPSPEYVGKPLAQGSHIRESHAIDYGFSFDQLAQIHVPPLHDMGFYGQGVTVAILDSGFDNLDHEVFVELNVVGMRDFVECDDDVTGDRHGTRVLSAIGGFAPGLLVGSAFRADFLLARTEDITSETPVEEDFWVAGLEWAERMGAQVASTSLSYTTWDPGTGVDYTYGDLDGDTARTTVAADIAASKGVVVVVAAGNEGDRPWVHVGAPADGDSVLTVGAVDSQDVIAPFSSRGPTVDGRIKPDVVARGVATAVAGTGGGITYVDGTSLSAPLVSGVCALLLQIHPEWTAYQIVSRMRQTARDLGPAGPDTLYGFGLVDAFAAAGLSSEEPIVSMSEVPRSSAAASLKVYPNPMNAFANVAFTLPRSADISLDVYNAAGQRVRRLEGGHRGAGRHMHAWDGRNASGQWVASGVYSMSLLVDGGRLVRKLVFAR